MFVMSIAMFQTSNSWHSMFWTPTSSEEISQAATSPIESLLVACLCGSESEASINPPWLDMIEIPSTKMMILAMIYIDLWHWVYCITMKIMGKVDKNDGAGSAKWTSMGPVRINSMSGPAWSQVAWCSRPKERWKKCILKGGSKNGGTPKIVGVVGL